MKYKILIVTGLSGAGRSTALKILEDIGFEAIDNLPTHLLKKVINSKLEKNLAVGIDVRTRDFDPSKVERGRVAPFCLENRYISTFSL